MMDRWIDRYSGILYHKCYCTGIFSWFISIVVVVTILESGVNFPLILYCLSAFSEWVSQLKKPWWHFKNTHITQSHIVRGLIHTPNHITQHVWRFSARGDDWNNTLHLSPSCGVKQKAPWWEAADRMEQLRAPLPPPDQHNVFLSLSSLLSLFFSCLTNRQEAVKRDTGEEDGVCQQSAPYLARLSQEASRAPTGSRPEQLIHCNRDSATKHG